MKMMQGAFFLPCSKRSRTRLAPTPTNISTKSEPEIEKNGNVRFARDGAREKGLAGAGRPDQQNAFRNASAELLELRRLAQKFNDFLQFFLGFFNARRHP